MCLSAALVGVIAFLRKQSLVGEALSHASFPGVIIGVIIAGNLSDDNATWLWLPAVTMVGAFVSAWLGLLSINFLEKSRIRSDSALCFILSAFFGVGITLSSHVQFTHSTLYSQSLNYLYGQAATMVDVHILIYGLLSLAVIAMVVTFYKELQALIFDKEYARSLGIKVNLIRTLIFLLVALAIVIGIRSVGVVLMSAMLIAPAAAARQFTHRLSMMMVLAGLFGLLSGYLGVYLSVEMTNSFAQFYPKERIAFPTGPMIVLVATAICLFALLFAPERGFFTRLIRRVLFRYQCTCENILKAMWRFGPETEHSLKEISRFQNVSEVYLKFIMMRLCHHGWVEKKSRENYKLTVDGIHRAAHIVRLHRLWELYLADYLGIGAERVHRSAEEMEHIITPEIERDLTELLKDPKYDPHHQPIPPYEGHR
jgi:manganese/zinc/iron transport system permease protein